VACSIAPAADCPITIQLIVVLAGNGDFGVFVIEVPSALHEVDIKTIAVPAKKRGDVAVVSMLVLNRKTTGASPATPVAPFVGMHETIVGWPEATSSEPNSVMTMKGMILENHNLLTRVKSDLEEVTRLTERSLLSGCMDASFAVRGCLRKRFQ
jgi:hypothetical protein